ncbi:hypothetical protein DSL72_008656 [Monilinia vaccinii-corymbosi]|uniref:Opioid growth factor receptor (OGFr) conserved domain-containing protein n=1 Tax=Monilinia vaccinii-corymbosi TaxID=61207 RepID=A0A8A3PQ24_9HELO|nr:hypothetical protein DSL72_008656 [Monilinia vaccinii-corymbosi]
MSIPEQPHRAVTIVQSSSAFLKLAPNPNPNPNPHPIAHKKVESHPTDVLKDNFTSSTSFGRNMSIMARFVEVPKHESRLVAFYRNKKPDDQGRFISDILQWNHRKLEETHDYIQWLFPLPEASMVSDAPLVDGDVFAAFHASSELQSELRKSLVKMLDFYGFKFADDSSEKDFPVIIKSSNFNDRCGNWLVNLNHNHLRISRILRSLRILGLEFEAAAFYKALSSIIYQKHRQIINNRSTEYWRRSAERPLHWAPDMTEDECEEDRTWEKGPEFLKNYEQIKRARDLQQQYDTERVLEEKKEAEFQATKAHIAALNADRKRKIDEANLSPQSRGGTSRESHAAEFQLDDKEDVVADTCKLIPESDEVVAEKDEAVHDESKPIKRKISKAGEAAQDRSNIVERKASANLGQPVIRQIQRYQLMAPHHP